MRWRRQSLMRKRATDGESSRATWLCGWNRSQRAMGAPSSRFIYLWFSFDLDGVSFNVINNTERYLKFIIILD
jgi:hypothetical protein